MSPTSTPDLDAGHKNQSALSATAVILYLSACKLLVHLQGQQQDLERYYASVEKVASVYHPYSMPYEHFDVFYCRGLQRPLNEIWPQVKNWD